MLGSVGRAGGPCFSQRNFVFSFCISVPSIPNHKRVLSSFLASFLSSDSYIFQRYHFNSHIFCGTFPVVHVVNCPELFLIFSDLGWTSLSYSIFRSTLDLFSSLIFVSSLQLFLFCLCSPKGLKVGQE